jgi:predicted molibdopterin-dependent oxidoreductase YjgC
VEYKNVLSTCVYCGTGCELYLQVIDGKIVGTLPAKGQHISNGQLCVKGWNVHGFVHHPDRLTTPLIRDQKGGELREATWDEALDRVISEFTRIRDERGADAMGFLCSAKASNETNYLFQKFVRAVMGTHNVDHCARL